MDHTELVNQATHTDDGTQQLAELNSSVSCLLLSTTWQMFPPVLLSCIPQVWRVLHSVFSSKGCGGAGRCGSQAAADAARAVLTTQGLNCGAHVEQPVTWPGHSLFYLWLPCQPNQGVFDLGAL